MSNPILDNRGVDPDESALGDFSVPAAPAQAPALEGAMPFDESNLVDSLTTPLAETPSLADKYTGTPVVQPDSTVQPEPTVQPDSTPQQIARTEYLGLPIPRSIDTTAPGVAPIPYKQYDAPGITPSALETLPPIDVRNLLPTLYEGPTSEDIERQLRTNREEIRGLIEKGESPLLEKLRLIPQPQSREGGFSPDSTRNAFDQWKIDVGLSAEYRRPDGSIDWGAAWSKMGSNAMYILGLPGNFIKAGVADLNNAVRGITLLSGGDFLAMAGGKEEVYYGRGSAVRPNFEDVGKNGANIWQALKGRQYNASDDYDPSEPFGLGEPGVPWYRDRGFWGGFFIDILTPDLLLESAVYEPALRGAGRVYRKVAPQPVQTVVKKGLTFAGKVLTTPIPTPSLAPLRELIGSSPIVKVASPGMQAPAVNPSANFKNSLAQPPLPSAEFRGWWGTQNPWTSSVDLPPSKFGKPAPAPRPVPRPTNLELPIPGPPAAPRPVPIKGGEPSVPTSLFQYPDEATQNALEPIRKLFDAKDFQSLARAEGFLRNISPIDRVEISPKLDSANSIVRFFKPSERFPVQPGRLEPTITPPPGVARVRARDQIVRFNPLSRRLRNAKNEIVPFDRPNPPTLVGAGDVPPPPQPPRKTLRDALNQVLDEGWDLGDGSRSYVEPVMENVDFIYNVNNLDNTYNLSPVSVFIQNPYDVIDDAIFAEELSNKLLEAHNRFSQSNQYLFISIDDSRFFPEDDFLPAIYGLGFRPYELETDTFYDITRRLTLEELAEKLGRGDLGVKFVYEPPTVRLSNDAIQRRPIGEAGGLIQGQGLTEPPTVQFPRGEGVPPRLERPKADDQAALTRMEPQIGRIEELQSRPKPTETPVEQPVSDTIPPEYSLESLLTTLDEEEVLPSSTPLVSAPEVSPSIPTADDPIVDTVRVITNTMATQEQFFPVMRAMGVFEGLEASFWRFPDMLSIIDNAPYKKEWFKPGGSMLDFLATPMGAPGSPVQRFGTIVADSILRRYDEFAQNPDFIKAIKGKFQAGKNVLDNTPYESLNEVVRRVTNKAKKDVPVTSPKPGKVIAQPKLELPEDFNIADYGFGSTVSYDEVVPTIRPSDDTLNALRGDFRNFIFGTDDNYVPIYKVREWLSARGVVNRGEQDGFIYALQGTDEINIGTLQEGFRYTPEQINAGIPQPVGGPQFFLSVPEDEDAFVRRLLGKPPEAIPEELLTNNLPDVVDYLDAPAPGHLLPEVPEVGIRSLEDINALGRFLVTNDGTPVPPFASMDELGDFVSKYPELANTLAIEGPMVPDLLKNTDVIPVVGRNNTYMLSAHTTWDNIDSVVRASIDADVDKAVQKLRSTTEKAGLLSVDSVLNWVRTQSLFDEFSTGLKQARSMVERLTASVNNPSRYDTLPDIGRRAILDEQPFNRTVGVRGVPTNAVEPLGTTFYHGTKVDIDPDDLPFIDPIAGGARGEAGPALYVTNNRNTARYYAQAPIQENVPLGDVPRDYTPGGRINQVVIPPDIKLLDAQDAADDTIYEVFKQAASDAGLPKKELTAYKSYFTRVKPDNVPKMFDKFTEYLRKSDIYDERMVLDFQRRVNTALFDLGYDGAQLPDGIALYNPAVIDTVKVVERVAESNPLNQAIARFNADSTVAAHNPRSGSSLVNMYESGVKVQANMLDQYNGRMNTLESYQTDLLNSVKQQTEALFPDVEQQLDSVEKAVKQRVDNLVQEYDANWNPCDF